MSSGWLPKALITEAQRERTLDIFVDAWLSSPDPQRLGAKAKSRTSTRLLDRHPGRQLVLTFKNGFVG